MKHSISNNHLISCNFSIGHAAITLSAICTTVDAIDRRDSLAARISGNSTTSMPLGRIEFSGSSAGDGMPVA